jgi:hypothetical protein
MLRCLLSIHNRAKRTEMELSIRRNSSSSSRFYKATVYVRPPNVLWKLGSDSIFGGPKAALECLGSRKDPVLVYVGALRELFLFIKIPLLASERCNSRKERLYLVSAKKVL